ncbi:putative Lon protease-like protein [Duffyella gerundensis]|jgi:Lon-like ATP-dependent protease|uniref:endopeptidase La n=1 Tax=Duffyella gerundensis TaxID=1619313 RepID=A0A0U5KYZ3_9GAMM|nr:Lon protease family protein [Duffyella gerundensis]QTO53067.1 Lon protease family protein [Duffyella gerundensis]CUU23561.1 putative Lon protease-like protein [Duffyella gerundensis]
MQIDTITLTSNQLTWRALQPDTDSYHHLFTQPFDDSTDALPDVQPRLFNALMLVQASQVACPLLLLRCSEQYEYLQLISEALESHTEADDQRYGGHYHINGPVISWQAADADDEPGDFVSNGGIHYADWIEDDQLFGSVRIFQNQISLEAGLLHKANGGTLVLSLRTLLAQPVMWLRLKAMLTQQTFSWISPDSNRPLPVSIPSMPLQLRLVLCGEREALADFQEMEYELSTQAIYSEFEENLQIADEEELIAWRNWVQQVAVRNALPPLAVDAWPTLIKACTRYTGDQETLPLCPCWLAQQLREAALLQGEITAASLSEAYATREWRESFLADRMRDEILLDQVLIETEGEAIGQINALSVVEFPGHPRAFGEPSRISCVVHAGDGEFTDVERKAELGGNIHAKGMMIMQAYLIAELELDQQLPFSASLVFEQSYSEVDGDSASLAELCALISALALQPINQQLAVTGSVDQFGNVQPVGGLNEKIEGFFQICQQRTLSGKQGVIIPASNVRHLSLSDDVVNAVREGQFSIWAVNRAEEALPLLTGVVWQHEKAPSLLQSIQERITQINQLDARQRPWPLRWLNWFNRAD